MVRLAINRTRLTVQRGFTLVELVVTIVVMGIMAFGTVSYITSSSQIYQQAASGDRLGTGARLVVDRLGREVRSALPNSVRVSSDGRCLEFVPVLAAGTYLTLAQGLDTSMTVLPLFEVPQLTVSSPRLSVYPVASAGIYSETTVSEPLDTVATPMADLALSATNLATSASPVVVSFNPLAPPDFPADSPQRRWFLVEEPVSFCVTVAGQLFRYQGDGSTYTYQTTQPNPPALLSASAGRWLVAEDLFAPSACGGGGNNQTFRVEDATLQRNAIVLIDLCLLSNQGGNLQLVHEVQLRNVP